MKGLIICCKDELTGFDKPQIEVNENSAIRGFAYALTNNEFLKQNAKNYSLWCLGELDSEKGLILFEKYANYPYKIVDGSSILNGVMKNGKKSK